MNINFNMSALIANSALANNDDSLSKSLEKLSSGFKINHAKDDSSGYAIAKKMSAQIEGLKGATANASNGISVIETAEGALSEIHSMVQRMNELSVQGSNGTCTTSDRIAMQNEVDQLTQEIERITSDTQFNGQTLLDGSFDLKGYTDKANVSVDYYSDEVTTKSYEFTIGSLATATNDASVTINLAGANAFPADSIVTCEGNSFSVKASGGFEMRFSFTAAAATGNVVADATGIGAMKLQIGASEGQELAVRIPKISLPSMGIDKLDLTSVDGARSALERMEGATDYISQVRSRLGAYQNRLEHSISSLDISEENMTAAYSRIMDVDMATEYSEYTKYQVMVQAGTSMVAQANERPQQALQLLQ